MDEPVQPAVPQAEAKAEGEEIETLPVLAGGSQAVHAQPVAGALTDDWRAGGGVIPAVQAAAMAAGGFVAGAAVVGLVHRHRQRPRALSRARRGRRGARGRGKAGELAQVVGSRSFLVDVHLLGGSGGNR